MGVERGAVAPLFADMDQAGIEQILRIAVGDAAVLGAGRMDHPFGQGQGKRQVFGRDAKRADDQNHAQGILQKLDSS